MTSSASFFIRDVLVEGDLLLAPMSGYNDRPFRRLCRQMGAAATYTGLLSASGIIYGSKRTDSMLRFGDDEHPLLCQIFGSDVDLIVAAAARVETLGTADVLDVNMGCAEPKIVKGGHGVALMRDPLKIARIFSRLTQRLSIPVTGKIRLGWDDMSRNYLEVARIIEENGAALLAVHGRTAEQAYLGDADWDAIAEIKQALKIPVLASGDVKCVADIERIKAHTACDGVLIGRAAIGNPWIFGYRDLADVPLAERLPMMHRHLQRMVSFHGDYFAVLRFRKHLSRYLANAKVPRRVRRELLLCDDAQVLLALLAEGLHGLVPPAPVR